MHNIPWKYVPSKQNPTDIDPRDCLANDLGNTLWFTGPKFLLEADITWPKSDIDITKHPQQEM